MEIKFYGGNCVRISTKKISVLVDDVAHLGAKSVASAKDIVIITDPRAASLPKESHFLINGPGEYEVSDVSISGVAARSHLDEENTQESTIYRVIIDDIRICVVGHIYPELSESQLESIGTVDILCAPVGGNGYTLDGIGAQKIIKDIEPKIVIPTHFDDGNKGINYEVPQQDLETAIKALGMESVEPIDSLKLKGSVDLPEIMRLVVLNRQN